MGNQTHVIAYPAVILQQGNHVLLGMRQNTPWGNGYYSVVTGKVEHGETLLQTAIRETYEEVGVTLQPQDLTLHTLIDEHCPDGARFLACFFVATQWQGSITNCEPSKCEEIAFFPIDALPSNTWPLTTQAIRSLGNTPPYPPAYQKHGW